MHQTKPAADSERMQCMEVWGGNQAVQRDFETPGLRIWVYNQPYGAARSGGDVYYLSSCASGRITRLMLADVCGHGEQVSDMAVGLRDLMRQNVNYIRHTRFVRSMNQQFDKFGKFGSFATALVGTFFAPTKTFSLCNAGHPPPLLFRQESKSWSELSQEADSEDVSDTPLGLLPQATYSQLDTRLAPGDMVLCFSDAVTESEDGQGRQLGREGVLQLVQECEAASPEDVIPHVVERLRSLAHDNLDQDDATLLLCQATGGGPTLFDNLMAPFRLFGRVTDRTTLE